MKLLLSEIERLGRYYSQNGRSLLYPQIILDFNPTNKGLIKYEQIYSLIKSLKTKGVGYGKISNYLNSIIIKTKRNTYWTNSKVHSYLKRYNGKSERQNYRNKFYEMKWIGKMSIKYYEIY